MFGFLKENSDKINLNNYTITTIVGNDTVVEGTIITKASVRIDGTLIGGVSAEGVVILSKNGKIKGNIMAENIVDHFESVQIQHAQQSGFFSA